MPNKNKGTQKQKSRDFAEQCDIIPDWWCLDFDGGWMPEMLHEYKKANPDY